MPGRKLSYSQATAAQLVMADARRKEERAQALYEEAERLERQAAGATGELFSEIAKELGVGELPEGWEISGTGLDLELTWPDPQPVDETTPGAKPEPDADAEEAHKEAA